MNSTKRARVLFVDHTAVLGGGEFALIALIRELDRTRYEPMVLLFAEGPLKEELRPLAETYVLPLPEELLKAKRDAVHISRVPWKKGMQILQFLVSLARLMRRLRPDLVHTNSIKANILGGLSARLLSLPLIWHIRDRIDEDYLPRKTVSGLRTMCRWIPTAIIANSAATLATLQLPKNTQATVISSGVDLSPFVESGEGAETLLQAISAQREVRIGIVGRICPWKGQDIFLRAAAIVHSSFPNTHFFIVGAPLFGEEEYERELRDLAAAMALNGSLTFMGFQRDVPRIMAGLHLIVHASKIPEPFGQVIVQGMAAGKPVIASEGGGPSEIIEAGKTGFLSSRGDPTALAATIELLLSTPELAQETALRGQEFVQTRYSAKQTTRSVEEIYQNLLSGSS